MHYQLKGWTLTPMFSYVFFGFQPYILDWVLFRRIRRKLYACDRPFIAWPSEVHTFKIFLHFDTTMIRCTIPQQYQPFLWVLLSQILNKDGRPVAIRSLSWHNDRFP